VRTLQGEQIWGDIGRVREHVSALRERGMGLKTVAELAGVSSATVTRLFYEFRAQKPTEKMTAEVARRLLAVRFNVRALPPLAIVDSCGARRRLQALIVAGWSVPTLAERAGMNRQWFRRYLFEERCAAKIYVQMLDLFVELWSQPPPPLSALASSRARASIERNGWLGLGVWDDGAIDDPFATPNRAGMEPVVDEVLVTRAMSGQVQLRALSEPERFELGRRWRERGGTLTSFAILINRSHEVARRYFEPESTEEQRKSA
jgi:AraC-like DNA-binding protein